MKNADKPAAEAIVQDLLDSQENVSNEEMAAAVSERLGVTVSRNDISVLRTETGCNRYQIIERDANRRLDEEAERLRREFAAQGVQDVPRLALDVVVTQRWEIQELEESKRDLAMHLGELEATLVLARERLKSERLKRDRP